jgi:hypothetical protein
MKFFEITIHPYIQPGVESWFEEHEDGVQHLPCPAQLPDFNIIEPLWSVSKKQIPSSIISEATRSFSS